MRSESCQWTKQNRRPGWAAAPRACSTRQFFLTMCNQAADLRSRGRFSINPAPLQATKDFAGASLSLTTLLLLRTHPARSSASFFPVGTCTQYLHPFME